jgi:hypothetical protein
MAKLLKYGVSALHTPYQRRLSRFFEPSMDGNGWRSARIAEE